MGARASTNVLSAILSWYVANVAPTTATTFDDTVISHRRRFLSVAVAGSPH